ncbi:energy-coupling factor transporter transmembrane component T family protein [Zhurongbacter thermophilus]
MYTALILLFTFLSSQIRSLAEGLFIAAIWAVLMVYFGLSRKTLKALSVLGVVEMMMFILILLTPGPPLFSIGPIVITTTGLYLFFRAIVRWFFAVSLTLQITETVGIETLMTEWEKIGIPEILIKIILLTYRYLFIFLDTLKNLLVAIKMRDISLNPLRKEGRYIGSSVVKQLLLESFHRYKFVSLAISMRGGMYISGYSPHLKSRKIKPQFIHIALLCLIGGSILWLL